MEQDGGGTAPTTILTLRSVSFQGVRSRLDYPYACRHVVERVRAVFARPVILRGNAHAHASYCSRSSQYRYCAGDAARWLWWFNYHRLLEPIGYVPPVEHEEAYYRRQEGQVEVATLNSGSLR